MFFTGMTEYDSSICSGLWGPVVSTREKYLCTQKDITKNN